MLKRAIGVLSLLFAVVAVRGQTTAQPPLAANNRPAAEIPSMPSEAEIGELVSKASEYVETYRRTFKNTKPSLDKAPTPGFYEQGMTLSDQASSVIAAIQKNGSTAVSLVSLLAILDDMSLNAAKATAATMMVAISQNKADSDSHGMQDFQEIAQAGKNCYDISELLFHATLRYISSEEAVLRVLLDRQKQQ